MMRRSWTFFAIVCLLLVQPVGAVRANLRAPLVDPHDGSSALSLRVSYRRSKAPGLWQRWLRKVDTLVCRDLAGKRIGTDLSRTEQRPSFTLELVKEQLPDQILCELGSERVVDSP